MAKIVLGVSSSIAIYKACDLIRALQKRNHEVQVVMTSKATQFISPHLFQALTAKPVLVNLFGEREAERLEHINLARQTELLLIAPATANIIAKMATGIADDFLSTFYLAVECPVIVAPAMNEAMYLHPRTQANLAELYRQGVVICEPEKGYLACGEEGWGRLAEIETIVDLAQKVLASREKWKNKKILITAGPTREPIDPVRFISNRSSGKMGYELAQEGRRRGAEVILISGPTSLPSPYKVKVIRVETANEMKREVEKYFDEVEVIIMAAAVADFRPAEVMNSKWKKTQGVPEIKFVLTEDILGYLMVHPLRQEKIIVGFAAETENLEAEAKKKLKEKGLDLIVANNISCPGIGFEADFNDVLILDRYGQQIHSGIKSKREISQLIFEAIEAYREKLT
ncbi:MAG: bifunctional phosphopantothenoylcysteine decarboxylase/phosphopantothenate--cysteine ligase CoaBC [Candidatus Aminicenantes bacterium]|nr:bifunctional phosphopantothenoylcysteine decarboxylase/phosphopantothenate--cysteine ligase CoaBC [Candidatus Aminicenantes bacterium]